MTPSIVLVWHVREAEKEGDKMCLYSDFGHFRIWLEPREPDQEKGWWDMQLTDRYAEEVHDSKHMVCEDKAHAEREAQHFCAEFFYKMATSLSPMGPSNELRFQQLVGVNDVLYGLATDGRVFERTWAPDEKKPGSFITDWTQLKALPKE